MPRLIWVFAGLTLILLALSCRGSHVRQRCSLSSLVIYTISPDLFCCVKIKPLMKTTKQVSKMHAVLHVFMHLIALLGTPVACFLRFGVHWHSVWRVYRIWLKKRLHIWATPCENLFLPYANNKGADQPAHPRCLSSAFVFRCLDRTISLVSISEIPSL